jgi:hypothetical protein
MTLSPRRRWSAFGVPTLLLIPFFCSFSSEAAAEKGTGSIAEITFLLGEVRLESGSGRREASLNGRLQTDDRLVTGDEALCEISFNNGPILRLGELSELVLTTSGEGKQKNVSGQILAGRLWSNCSRFVGDPERFKTQSPTCVCGIRGTIWRLEVSADSSTICRVYEGQVAVSPSWSPSGSGTNPVRPGPPREVEGPQRVAPPEEVTLEEWLLIVRRHQEVTVGPDRSRPTARPFDPARDEAEEWVRWNKARDRAAGR